MSQVQMMQGESFDSLLRRFNKKVQQDGILAEARRRAHFEPPYIERKKKLATKRRKSRRTTAKTAGRVTPTPTRPFRSPVAR